MTTSVLTPTAALVTERPTTTFESFEARLARLFPTTTINPNSFELDGNYANREMQRMALEVRNIILDGAGIPDANLAHAIRVSYHTHTPARRF